MPSMLWLFKSVPLTTESWDATYREIILMAPSLEPLLLSHEGFSLTRRPYVTSFEFSAGPYRNSVTYVGISEKEGILSFKLELPKRDHFIPIVPEEQYQELGWSGMDVITSSFGKVKWPGAVPDVKYLGPDVTAETDEQM